MAEKSKQDLLTKLLEKGGDIEHCLKLLKEVRVSEEKAIEREERIAERELEKAKIERDIRLKELELKEKEVAIGAKSTEYAKPKVNLPKFSEGDDIEVFLKSYEKLAESYQWKHCEWAIRLVPQLSGKAFEAYSRMSVTESNDYNLVKRAILERYGLNALAYRDKFQYAKQDKSETFKEYAIRVESYLKHWVTAENVCNNYERLYDLFMREQLMFTASADLQIWLRERNPKTFIELVESADTYQLAHKQSIVQIDYQRYNSQYTQQENKKTNQSFATIQKQPFDNVKKCFYCSSPDHFIANCPEKKAKDNKSTRQSVKQINESLPSTHTSALLLSPKKLDKGFRKVSLPVKANYDSSDVKILENGLKLVKGFVNGREAWMLRDTGCTTVCISNKFADQIGSTAQEEKWISLANGENCLCHEIEVRIDSPFVTGVVAALTMNCPFDVILGENAYVKDNILKNEGLSVKGSCCEILSSASKEKKERNEFEQNTPLEYRDSYVNSIETRQMKAKREKQDENIRKAETEYQQDKYDTHRKNESADHMLHDCIKDISDSLNFKKEQQSDETLTKVRELAKRNVRDSEDTFFFMKNGILYRHFKMQNGVSLEQLVVPYKYRRTIMQISHDTPLGGHLGNKKTREKILVHFYWPGIFPDVAIYCRSCKNCQKCFPKGRIQKAPLISIPPMEEPFKRLAMDIVGPLNRSIRGHKYILVLCDYATKYP